VALSAEAAAALIERLKQEADRHWYINPQHSLNCAAEIIAIGRARGDKQQIALGLMARGDALKLIGRMDEAWDALEESGRLFLEAGDDVGWARTCIGRLYVGLKLGRARQVLADGEQARRVFIHHGLEEKRLRLEMNAALVHAYLGDYQAALNAYQAALNAALGLGAAGEQHLSGLYINLGMAYGSLGDFRQASAFYEKARALAQARRESWHQALVEINLAYLARSQGRYREALRLLHGLLEREEEAAPQSRALAQENLAGCYLFLNRYAEARELALALLADHALLSDRYERGRTLLHLATAEAELANFPAAQAALNEAEAIFMDMGATALAWTVRLWRGQVLLRLGEVATARQVAAEAEAYFQQQGQHLEQAAAALLRGRAALALAEANVAEIAGQEALAIAQRHNVAWLRYGAYLLLGQAAEQRHRLARATRYYQAAAAAVERVQRGLTLTLRPGFMEDKDEALHALVRSFLKRDRPADALEALERARAQTWLSFLMSRERLVWSQTDPRSRALLAELAELRAEHEWYQSLARDLPRSPDSPRAVSQSQALAEAARRERRMRNVIEQLYLINPTDLSSVHAPVVALRDFQPALAPGVRLVEFFSDGAAWWAFVVGADSLAVRLLPVNTVELGRVLAQLQSNLTAALQLPPEAAALPALTRQAQRLLQRLYAWLMEPLALDGQTLQRLIIVPYGMLHYLPFHLLCAGDGGYLIERCEVGILPTAAFLTRPGPRRTRSAVALAHSWGGRLPHVEVEARAVQQQFGGSLHVEAAATRAALQQPARQILHIAAHGEHRLDQPDLSYIQLADGRLLADDLMQQDLSYELITLSACETGQARVAGGEDLIGLGRGFLYAGAGALVTSLWPVADDLAARLMRGFYAHLSAGASKAAALREAQIAVRAENPSLHPAYWGAFQLVGNPDPLSA
jgi:CHAT domain-containing protein